MRVRDKKNLFIILPFLLLLSALLSGCAAPLHVEYSPALDETKTYAARSAGTVTVRPFIDARPKGKGSADPRVIGAIDATTQDIYGQMLVLEEPPARLVTDAFRRYLAAAGFRVSDEESGGTQSSGIVISGEVRRFVLDVGGRDKIDISLYIEMREGTDGRVVWFGVVEEKGSRYAGVFGASRANLSKYLSKALTKVFAKTLERAGAVMRVEGGPAKVTEEDRYGGPGDEGKISPGRSAYKGGLVIRTTPPRVKVFINGVYYGLTPIDLRLSPGVYELLLRKDGFMDLSEKVAVDSRRDTEVEERLRKKE